MRASGISFKILGLCLVPIVASAVAACQPQGDRKQDDSKQGAGAAGATITTAESPAPAAPPNTASEKSSPSGKAGACMMQDGKPLAVKSLRALGTEPFWGAEIEGRCVTYNHPDDQKGTRIWTRYTATPDGGRWSGSLDGRKFELVTRAVANCSDGMSDNKFPIAVGLMVNGEQREGCAK